MIRNILIGAGLASAIFCATPPAAQAQQSQLKADAALLLECVIKKAGPESGPPAGNSPAAIAARQQIKQEMEGGPVACVGIIAQSCKPIHCHAREARAWLAIAAEDNSGADPKSRSAQVTRAAVQRIRPNAVQLCEATAASSAWGRQTVDQKGRYGMDLDSGCVREMIAYHVLTLIAYSRGM